MRKRRGQLTLRAAWVIPLLALLTLGLGTWGWIDRGQSFADALYRSAAMFSYNDVYGGGAGIADWRFQVGRWIGLVVVFSAALVALAALLQTQLAVAVARGLRQEVVVIGADRSAAVAFEAARASERSVLWLGAPALSVSTVRCIALPWPPGEPATTVLEHATDASHVVICEPHDAQSLVRLGWFVSPLGLVLGILGLLAALREWRPRYLFPVLLGLTVSVFYLYKLRVWNDYPFALRRFVPVTLPLLVGLAAFLLARLAGRGGLRRAAAAGLALALAAIYAKDTARIARYVDWRGAVRFVADVARRFGPEDVVVFEQPKSVHLLSLPLWAAHGVNVLELARFNPDPDRLRPEFDSGDHLHLNAAGYAAMAEAIDLSLLPDPPCR